MSALETVAAAGAGVLWVELVAPTDTRPAHIVLAGPLGGRREITARQARTEAERLVAAADALERADRNEGQGTLL